MSDQHKVILYGAGVAPDRVSAHVFRDLLDVFLEGAERALRFRMEGRSTAKGAPPHWLRSASDFSLVRRADLEASAALIEACPLIETMSERFKQGDMFVDLDPRQSPLELFEAALEDALLGNEDSDRFDLGLLRTIERFDNLFSNEIGGVEIINGRTIRIDRAAIARVRQISAKAYSAQRVRIAGRLETIRYSDCRFTLVLLDGTTLQGTALELGHDALQNHFGRTVVVTGKAVFRASGKPLRIEAESIEIASERDAVIWSSAPKPLLAPHPGRQLREEQRGKMGFGALLGQWPGDESDEELKAAMEAPS